MPVAKSKQQKGTPAWVKAIPPSTSHGSGHLQKRLWRLTSDYVRIRDWHKYGGECVATGVKISHWTAGDAGHYKSYSTCNGLYKFNPQNIHLQSKSSNGWGGQTVGHYFGEELKCRYGKDILEKIQKENRDTPLKFTTQDILNEMEWYIAEMATLQEKPDYYQRVKSLLTKE